MNIMVLNLPRKKTDKEVSALFAAYGEVESCSLVMGKEKGTSKGFGFVEMKDNAEAEAAIAGLHGSLFGNSKIRVKVSTKSK